MERRKFITNLTVGGAAAALLAPKVAEAKNKFRWKLSTTWPPKFPILHEGLERFSKLVSQATGDGLKIKIYGGGELIPPLGLFDAVSQGTLQMGHGASYYWAGKVKAATFFSSVPFGLTTQHFNSWLNVGGGQELWEEVYAPFDLHPISLGNTVAQMAGWFRKEIKSIDDFKGLKMRIPGLGGSVVAKAGANVVLMPGSEVYTALERGTIDATEWVGPFFDERMGLQRAAGYYYYPGWHEPCCNLELTVNKKAWNSLPKDYQAIVRSAAYEVGQWIVERQEFENGPALARLQKNSKIKVLPLPKPVLVDLKKYTDQVLAELIASDPMSAKVHASFMGFKKQVSNWSLIGEESLAAALRI